MEEEEVFGQESCCQHCHWGKMLKIKLKMTPWQVRQEKKDNPAFEEPPVLYAMRAHCGHKFFTGQHDMARPMESLVVECELFESRKITTTGSDTHGP